jgi:mannose-6-phosphate isomerase-like protein (cupin superfamily)
MEQIARSAADCPCFRIAAGETNYFVILAEPRDGVPFVTVVEIFQSGGATPPNMHRAAHEQFYVLSGTGIARNQGVATPVKKGDILVVPPGQEHTLENTGSGKLYCLTTMMPDEDFAALIRNGVPETLDAEDIAVLSGL